MAQRHPVTATQLAVAALGTLLFSASANAELRPIRLVATNASAAGEPTPALDLIVDADGSKIRIPVEQLRQIERLRIDRLQPVDGHVLAGDLGDAQIDELSDELRIVVRPDLLTPSVLGSGAQRAAAGSEPISDAALIEYEARATKTLGRATLAGRLDAYKYVGDARVELSLAARDSGGVAVQRLRAVREDLATSSAWEVGTVYSRAGSRGSSASLLGIGYFRDRGVAPGYIQSPHLRVDGQAAGRSTIDVLIDNQRVASHQTVGPFSLTVPPASDGSRVAVVVKDDLGQERVISGTLFSDPTLLAVGQSEFGAWAGALEVGNLRTEGLASTGYYRRGITNWLTAEGGYELQSTAKARIARLGAAADVATLAGRIGVDLRGHGSASQASVRYSVDKTIGPVFLGLNAQASRAGDTYRNLGGAASPGSSQLATLTIGLYGSHGYITRATTSSGTLQMAGLSTRVKDINVQLSASRFEPRAGKAVTSAYLGVSIPLGRVSGSVSSTSTAQGITRRYSAGYSQGAYSASGTYEQGATSERVQVDGFARMSAADVQLGLSKRSGQQLASRAGIAGAAAIYAGSVIPMRPTYGADDGFAVFDLGAEGVNVRTDLGVSSTTGSDGIAVVPIRSLHRVQLSIDSETAGSIDLAREIVSVHRRAGVLIKRRAPIAGQFVDVGAAEGVVVLDGQRYPVTDRGVWLELVPGTYSARVNGVEQMLTIR